MNLSQTDWAVVVHGMGFGALFLLAFAGGFAGLWSLRPGFLTDRGLADRLFRLRWGMAAMALSAWAACVTGTFIVYPWYRARPPAGVTDLARYPRYFLLADPQTAGWHEFGMEWKEHVAWVSPILATAVAFVVWRYGRRLFDDGRLRRVTLLLFAVAFATAGVAGLLGAFITKMAPVR